MSKYWYQGVQYDTNYSPAGKWAEVHAYTDPDSYVSTQNLYGGIAGAEAADRARAATLGQAAYQRPGVSLDTANSDQQRGVSMGIEGDLQRAMAGDANSVAQQQLQGGYARSNALAMGQGNSARGGLASQVLAHRAASDAVGANGQRMAIAGQQLQAQEQLGARSQYGSLAGAMHGSDLSQAFGQADLAAQQRAANDAMYANYANQRTQIGQMGMSGRQATESARIAAYNTAQGLSNDAEQRRINQQDLATRQALAGASGAATTAGQIWNQSQQQQGGGGSTKNKDDDDFKWG